MPSGEVKIELINGKYDIDWDDNGDRVQDDGLETAIDMSLLLDKRADESEVAQPFFRGGWWGSNIINMFFSKLWLVNGRKTQDKLNQAIEYANAALFWLIEEGYASEVNSTAEFTDNGISLSVTITKLNDIVLNKNYELWLNTPY